MPLKLRTTLLILLLSQLFYTTPISAKDLAPQYEKFSSDIGVNPQSVLDRMLLIVTPPQNTLLNAQHHYTLSLTYLTLAYPQKSLIEANLALDSLSDIKADWLYHSIMVVKTQAMELSGQAKEALPLIQQTVQWAIENNDNELLVDALVGLGYIENTLRESIKALDAFMRAYELAPEKDATVTKSAIASSIALVYEYRKENELAIPYFQESVEYHRATKNLLELSIALYGLGRANKNIGKTELGNNQLQESLEISRAINDDQGVAYALKELAPLYIENGQTEQAESMLTEAAELFELSKNKYMLFDVHKTLTVLYMKQNSLLKAQLHLNQAKSYLNHDRMPMQSIALAEIEAKLLATQDNHQMAFEQLYKTVGEKQRLLSEQSTRQLHELRAQFEIEEQANANELLVQENAVQKLKLIKEQQQNQTLLIAISATTVILLLLLLLAIKSRKQKQQLFISANFDSLTGLANRPYILQQLNACHQQLKAQQSMHIAMLDLDHFKQINDQLGHDVGDQVLNAMGVICQEVVVAPHLVGRFGGEEFLFAFIDIPYDNVQVIIEKIRQQASNINQNINANCPAIGFSVGITSCKAEDSLKHKIIAADLAMYAAKNAGRNKTERAD